MISSTFNGLATDLTKVKLLGGYQCLDIKEAANTAIRANVSLLSQTN